MFQYSCPIDHPYILCYPVYSILFPLILAQFAKLNCLQVWLLSLGQGPKLMCREGCAGVIDCCPWQSIMEEDPLKGETK